MSKAAVISGRVDEDMASRLDLLAARIDRSRGWIVARAVEQYVASETALFDSLDEAEAQIDRGDYWTQAQMERWLAERDGASPRT